MLDLVLFLKSVPLFRALCFEDIARIAEKTETVSVPEGQALFEAGASITHIHVLRTGKIELSSNGMIVDVLKAGTSIGEHAIFGHAEHEVSAHAAEDCLLLRFPVGLLADVVAEHPQSLGPITSDLIRRLHKLYAYLAETRKGVIGDLLADAVPAQSPAIPTPAVAAKAAAPLIDGIVMA